MLNAQDFVVQRTDFEAVLQLISGRNQAITVVKSTVGISSVSSTSPTSISRAFFFVLANIFPSDEVKKVDSDVEKEFSKHKKTGIQKEQQ